MRVEHKEGMTFIVTSSDSGEQYEVQLDQHRPHGWCGCPDYQHRRAPHHPKMVVLERCKHIQAVVEHVAQRVVSEYVSERQKAAAKNVQQAAQNRRAVSGDRQAIARPPAPVRPVQNQTVDRPAPHHTAIGRPVVGVGAKQPPRPVPPVPRLGQG